MIIIMYTYRFVLPVMPLAEDVLHNNNWRPYPSLPDDDEDDLRCPSAPDVRYKGPTDDATYENTNSGLAAFSFSFMSDGIVWRYAVSSNLKLICSICICVGRGGSLVAAPFVRRVACSHSCRHIVTLGKSFTCSCLWRFGTKPRHSIRAMLRVPLSTSGLEEEL